MTASSTVPNTGTDTDPSLSRPRSAAAATSTAATAVVPRRAASRIRASWAVGSVPTDGRWTASTTCTAGSSTAAAIAVANACADASPRSATGDPPTCRPAASIASAAEDRERVAVGHDRDCGAVGQWLVREQDTDVEELGERAGLDHARLLEEGVERLRWQRGAAHRWPSGSACVERPDRTARTGLRRESRRAIR